MPTRKIIIIFKIQQLVCALLLPQHTVGLFTTNGHGNGNNKMSSGPTTWCEKFKGNVNYLNDESQSFLQLSYLWKDCGFVACKRGRWFYFVEMIQTSAPYFE